MVPGTQEWYAPTDGSGVTHSSSVPRVAVAGTSGWRRRALTRAVAGAGYDPVGEDQPADVALVWWPPKDGASAPDGIPWIAVVADGSSAGAHEALGRGARDYVLSRRGDELRARLAGVVDGAVREQAPHAGPATVLDALPSGVAVLAADGTVNAVNTRLCALEGCSRTDLVGTRAVHDRLLARSATRTAALFAAAEQAGRASDVFRVGPGDGRVVVADLTATRDDGGRVSAFMLSLRPRNQRERIADALAAVAVAASRRDGDVCAAIAREGADLLAGTCGVVMRAEERGFAIAARHGGQGRGDDGIVPIGDPTAAAAAFMRRAAPDAAWVRSAPLQSAGGTWGVLAVAGTGDESDDARERLEHFTRVASIATASLSGARLPELDRDPLTGLLSNRAFFGRLDSAFAGAKERGERVSLAIIDLDGFRRVNDALGRVEGDRILAAVSEKLRSVTPPGHSLGRLGGEEFGWLLPNTPLEDAFDLVREARRAVAECAVGDVRVTASLGLSEAVAAQADSIDELRQQAEVALNWAKVSGGNRCVSYSFRLAEEVFARKAELTAEGPSLRGMRALAWAVDARDPHTHRHSLRVADLAVRIATALGWDTVRTTHLREAGLVHDVGKIAVPDRILFKPTRLNAEEFALVTRHPGVGAQIVADVLSPEQASWVRGHHERWDGKGYPDALVGEEIPEEARVLALADAWDVMTSVRAYQEPVTLDGAITEIRRCRGSQFWPEAVDALCRLVASGAVGVHGVTRSLSDVAAAAGELAA